MALFGEELVTRTKFVVPTPRRQHLLRPRLQALLAQAEDARLVVVQAPAGFGKSALLAAHLRAEPLDAWWYELSERDADPQTFLIHLAHLAHRHLPGSAQRALSLLAAPGGAARQGEAVIEALTDAWLDALPGPTWLVLDDFHRAASAEVSTLVNHLVKHAPPALRVVLATRAAPELRDLSRWRLAEEVLTVDQTALAFLPEEVQAWLARMHGVEVTLPEAEAAATDINGWPMALPLLRDRAAGDAGRAAASSRLDLFAFLASEALAALPEDLRQFLLATAALERLEPSVCAPLAHVNGGSEQALALLRRLHDHGLFLQPLGGGVYRHHHLMREYLLAELARLEALVPARRAAAHALAGEGQAEEAVAQLLAAGDAEPALAFIALLAPGLVNQGRGAVLAQWAEQVPPATLQRAPAVLVCLGDAARLAGQFDTALAWYEQARVAYGDLAEGRARARAGMALVYLDTARPSLADPHLQGALEGAEDPRVRAELLVLLAENRLNRGDTAGAVALYEQVRGELPELAAHQGRLQLRLGRLHEARQVLQAAAHQLQRDDSPTQAHREPALVLAFVEALCGDALAAERAAEAGLARARRQQAAWAEAVGLMRRGHARLVGGQEAEAAADYAAALRMADTLGVARLRAEPLLGQAILAARQGDGAAAERCASEAVAVAEAAGDAWMAALSAMGPLVGAASDQLAGLKPWLERARAGFEATGDVFGQACVALVTARLAASSGETAVFLAAATELAERVRQDACAFLVAGPSLLGFADASAAQHFVHATQQAGLPAEAWQARGVALPALVEGASGGPGTPALRIWALGSFRVEVAGVELKDKAFGREKARQLLHLLIASRGQPLSKGHIIDTLWPETDPATADGTFRVALNALNRTLEPDRAPGAPARFVVRRGGGYMLLEPPDVWLDLHAFETALERAVALEAAGEPAEDLIAAYVRALSLYEGPFLQAFTAHEAWCDRERERLAQRFADGALRLCRLYARGGDHGACILWAGRLLEREPLSEEAYRLLMAAYYQQGDRAAALRTYDRCVVVLSDELDIDPMPETQRLASRIEQLQPLEAV